VDVLEGIKDVDAHRLSFLLADFEKSKDEIARRSGLQERALAMYFAVVAYAVLQVGPGDVVAATATWVAAWLALAYYVREHLEIARLGSLVRDRIAEPVAQILGAQAADVVPSEASLGDSTADVVTKKLNRRFMWISFAGIPLVLTCVAVWHADDEWRLLDPRRSVIFLSVGAILAAIGVIRMLRGRVFVQGNTGRRVPPSRKQTDA